MRNHYIIYGKNVQKEWPIVCYDDVRSAKLHFDKLKEFQGKDYNPYDPTKNKADKYFVIKVMGFYHIEGYEHFYMLGKFAKYSDDPLRSVPDKILLEKMEET